MALDDKTKQKKAQTSEEDTIEQPVGQYPVLIQFWVLASRWSRNSERMRTAAVDPQCLFPFLLLLPCAWLVSWGQVGSGGVPLRPMAVFNSPEMGAALFRSPTSSSNSEAKTDDGSWMKVAC